MGPVVDPHRIGGIVEVVDVSRDRRRNIHGTAAVLSEDEILLDERTTVVGVPDLLQFTVDHLVVPAGLAAGAGMVLLEVAKAVDRFDAVAHAFCNAITGHREFLLVRRMVAPARLRQLPAATGSAARYQQLRSWRNS